jgi:hypothetical protein
MKMNDNEDLKEKRLLLVTCISVVAFLGVMVGTSFLLWNRGDKFIMWIPVYALQGGFCGGMVAVFYRVAILRGAGLHGEKLYAWVVAKPIMGIALGGVVYLLVASGESALNGTPTINNYELVGALAFLGGFSDRFSLRLLNHLAGKWAESGERPAAGTGGREEGSEVDFR